MDTTTQPQQYSDIAVIFVLLYTLISVVALSVLFVKKSKLHLIWTLTLGSLLAFIAAFLLVDLFNTGWLGAIASILLTMLSLFIWLACFGSPSNAVRSRNHSPQSHVQREIERLHRLGGVAPRQSTSTAPPPPLSPAQRKKIKRQRNRPSTTPQPPTRDPYARKGTQVAFTYTNNKGITKSRRVQITEIDSTYLHGIDLDIHEMRTFTLNKIHHREVTNINTGEIIKVKNL